MIKMQLEPFRQNLRRFLRKVATTSPKLDMIGRNLLLPPKGLLAGFRALPGSLFIHGQRLL